MNKCITGCHLKATCIAFSDTTIFRPSYLSMLTGHEASVARSLSPPTCDLLYTAFMQHTSTPAFTPSPPRPFISPCLSPWLFLSTHSSLEASLFLLGGIASWLIHNQAMTLQLTPGSLIMENKQTTETLELLLQGLKLYLASFFLKQVHTCTARSIFIALLLIIFAKCLD